DKVPILLVTDDQKEDWWWKDSPDDFIGPRSELRYEFFDRTGQSFYAYRPAHFLALVRQSDSALVSDATVQEMQRVQNRRLVSASSLRIRSKIRELS
ncbi:PIN-like domain-containing protein, partial [Mesorhizobium sp. M2E.F.Ca.ET.166.01.1.1]